MPYREGFIKNRYIGRTFIMPGQAQRKKSVRQKLNPIDLEFRGKNVLLVDDSIVRGTTSREIIQMAREAGAAQGVLRLRGAAGALPQRLRHRHADARPNWSRTAAPIEELEKLLGADRLIYQDLPDLIEAVRAGNPKIERFDCSVFTGEYVTQDISAEYLNQLELFRSDAAKEARKRGGADDARSAER